MAKLSRKQLRRQLKDSEQRRVLAEAERDAANDEAFHALAVAERAKGAMRDVLRAAGGGQRRTGDLATVRAKARAFLDAR